METFGWANFDMKDEPGNNAFMAATTMSEILEMKDDEGEYVYHNNKKF